MLLAIDAGNTNIVFAAMEGTDVIARWRIATDARRTADEYAVWLRQLMLLVDIAPAAIDQVIISTVVPRALHNLTLLAEKYLDCQALVAGRGEADYGLVIDVEEPGSLGADRAVNAVAAHAAHGGDLIVIDFGTATTVDHIDYTGAYKGGIIAPGINLSLDALVAAAAKLPNIAIEAPVTNSVIGRNTEEQMHIGVYWGYVSLIEGLVQRMRTEIARPVKVIATGGLAKLFDKHTDLFDAVEPDLTLNGLALIAARVESKT